MTCKACDDAERYEYSGSYHASCGICTARMLLRSPMGWEGYLASQQAGRLTPDYRALLARMRVEHEAVKEAARRFPRPSRESLA